MIYFYNTNLISNYETAPGQYRSMKGRELTSYYYWILKNAGCNVALVNSIGDIEDARDHHVVFHYDERAHIQKLKNIRKVQWVSDRPTIKECEFFLMMDHTLCGPRHFYVHHPLPVGTVRCTPSFPPKIFSCICHSIVLLRDIRAKKETLENKYNINIRVQHMDWFNKGDEDVFFMVRQPCGQPGHKPATRLFISQAMGVPAVLSHQDSYDAFSHINNKYILASTYDDFEHVIKRLTSEPEYFNKYIPEPGVSVDSINKEIVQQFKTIFKENI